MPNDDSMPTHEPQLDQTALDSIRAIQQPGQPDLLTRIIDTYLASAAELIKAMQTSHQAGDIEVLGRSAHTLKSSAASLGAMRVSHRCGELEADVRAGRLDNVESLIADICREQKQISLALKRERIVSSTPRPADSN